MLVAARGFTMLPRVRLLVTNRASQEMKRIVLRIRPSPGFSLVELLVVVAVAMIVMAVAVPSVTATMQSYALNSGVQIIASTVRSARLAAVSKNRQVRVLFNCPIAGQMRAVEVTGNAAIDNAADRCSTTTYPYPDPNPAAVPNIDGPVVVLPEGAQFGAFESVLIGTDGRVTPQTGCPAACVASAVPATVILSNTHDTRTITVAASGQVITP
jgi:Tfp pilus assembly protein FimT